MKVSKTPLSKVVQFRLFGVDFMFGYMKIKEAAEIADLGADPNDILKRREDSE